MVKSGLISGGPDMASYENMARFRMISGATLANSTLKY